MERRRLAPRLWKQEAGDVAVHPVRFADIRRAVSQLCLPAGGKQRLAQTAFIFAGNIIRNFDDGLFAGEQLDDGQSCQGFVAR